MASLEDLLYINDYTLPSLFRRNVQMVQTQEDVVEPMSDGAGWGGALMIQFHH